MTAFDNGIALQPAGDGLLRGRTVPEWANMVGPFGGGNGTLPSELR